MSVLRGVYVSKLRVREIGWKYRNVRNATNLVFTLESGISFMFNSTVQQVKSTKKVQNGKIKALDPGRRVLLQYLFYQAVSTMESVIIKIHSCFRKFIVYFT